MRSGAFCSLKPVARFLRLAGSSRVAAVRDFRFLTMFLFVFCGATWVCHLVCGGPLAVLSALLTSTSWVPVLTFSPGALSVFLAYLYTWYWLLAFFCLKIEKQRYHWKRLFKAWLHV